MKFFSLVITSIIVCISVLTPFNAISQKAAGWAYMYSFDGNAYDVGPNRNHGEIIGTVNPVADRFGRKNKALNFNGGTGYIKIPFTHSLNLPATNFTFTIWVYVDKYAQNNSWSSVKTSNYSPIFTKSEKSSKFQYRFGATDKGFYFDGGEGLEAKGLYTSNNVALVPGKWNMLCVSYNGYVMKLFLNDKIIISANVPSSSFTENQEPLIIGYNFPGQTNYFSGSMDDLSIWEKFVSEDDVKQIYAVQSKYPFVPPNIVVPVKPAEVINEPVTPVTVIMQKDTVIDNVVITSPVVKEKAKALDFQVSKGSTFVLKHVLFEQSKAVLLTESYTELDQLAETLKMYPEMVIELSGHTDNQGSRDLNVKLSEQRALKVKQYLVDHGIEQKRISCKGYGPDQPISPNNTEENRRLNRRVEFKIIQM